VKILAEIDGGMKRNFLELLSATNASHDDLTVALEDLISEGLILRSSDGFVTVYTGKSQPKNLWPSRRETQNGITGIPTETVS